MLPQLILDKSLCSSPLISRSPSGIKLHRLSQIPANLPTSEEYLDWAQLDQSRPIIQPSLRLLWESPLLP